MCIYGLYYVEGRKDDVMNCGLSQQERTANNFRHYFIIARLLHLALYHSINESILCTLPFAGVSM